MTQTTPAQTDLAALNERFEQMGAVRVEADGFRWIDETIAPPALVRVYERLTRYAYATGSI